MSALRRRAFRAGRHAASGRGRFALPWLAGLLVLSALPAAGGVRVQEAAAWCAEDGPLVAADLPPRVDPERCDLAGRLIADHAVRVVVPPPGEGVLAEAVLADGGTQLLDVRTAADGTVVLRHVGPEHVGPERVGGASTGSGRTAGARHPCEDDAQAVSSYRDTTGYTWFYKASTTPPGLSIGAVAQDLVDGFNAVTGSFNDCGLGDEVDAVQRYGGNTTAPTGIDHTGACPAKGDGRYTVDFGNLPERMLARTCWRGVMTAAGFYEIGEADVKIRSGAALFTGSVPAGCTGARFSVKSIMAHEVGHAFGLGHVDEHTHGDLTMSQVTPACSLSPHTLGLGDVEALRALY